MVDPAAGNYREPHPDPADAITELQHPLAGSLHEIEVLASNIAHLREQCRKRGRRCRSGAQTSISTIRRFSNPIDQTDLEGARRRNWQPLAPRTNTYKGRGSWMAEITIRRMNGALRFSANGTVSKLECTLNAQMIRPVE